MRISKTSLIIFFLIFLDLLFVILHFYLGGGSELFNLDAERNFPTIYQSFKLVLLASLAFAHMVFLYVLRDFKGKEKLIFFPFWLGFSFLALDEIGSIHENLGNTLSQIDGDLIAGIREFFSSIGFRSSEWLLFYLPAIVFAGIYFVYLMKFFYKQKNKFYLFAFSTLLLFLVPIIEYISNPKENYTALQYNIFVSFEEILEMAGISLMIVFMLFMMRADILKFKSKNIDKKE